MSSDILAVCQTCLNKVANTTDLKSSLQHRNFISILIKHRAEKIVPGEYV